MAMYTLMEFNGDHTSDLYDKGGMLVPILAAVIANPSNAYLLEEYGLHRAIRVVKQSGNQYDDTRVNVGNIPDKGWVTQFVLDAVNHESAHAKVAMSQMKSEMRNLEERLNERITEAEMEVMARVVKIEEGDTPIQLHHTDKIGDHDERLVKLEETNRNLDAKIDDLDMRLVRLEDRNRDLLRVLCAVPEIKKILIEAMGTEADRG